MRARALRWVGLVALVLLGLLTAWWLRTGGMPASGPAASAVAPTSTAGTIAATTAETTTDSTGDGAAMGSGRRSQNVADAHRDLRVRLIDSLGAPIEALAVEAVSLRSSTALGETTEVEHIGLTDAEGLLVVHLDAAWIARVARRDGSRTCVLRPSFPGSESLGATINLDAPPTDDIVITLPSTGRVRFVVDGWRPRGSDARGRVEIELAGDDAQSDPAPRHVAAIDAAGIAVFPWVLCGRRWSARVVPSPLRQEFDGPVRHDELTEVHLAVPGHPTLRGRLLLMGQPLPATSFWFVAQGQPSDSTQHHAKTDADGSWRIDLHASAVGRALEAVEVVTAITDSEQALVARIGRTPVLVAGENDLGNIEVQPTPPLFAGHLRGRRPDEHVFMHVDTRDHDGGYAYVPKVSIRWLDGDRFVAHGTAPSEALHLLVNSHECLPIAPIAVVMGQRDLEVRLERGATVQADVIVGDDRAAIALAPRLLPTDGRTREALRAATAFAEQGAEDPIVDRAVPRSLPDFAAEEPLTLRYQWRGVPPGRYRLAWTAWGSTAPVVEVSVPALASDETRRSVAGPRSPPRDRRALAPVCGSAHATAVGPWTGRTGMPATPR